MAEVLLTSETFIKSVTNISDNVAGKFILPAAREAQETQLRGVVGDCLLAKLKELAAREPDGTRALDDPANSAYKDLVDQAQYFLAYASVAEVLYKVSYKVGNFGVARSTDEHLQAVPQDEVAKQIYYYQSKADGWCRRLQHWILQNKAAFPELRVCDCASLQANLRSSATCGVFLGGTRGKVLPGGGGCC